MSVYRIFVDYLGVSRDDCFQAVREWWIKIFFYDQEAVVESFVIVWTREFVSRQVKYVHIYRMIIIITMYCCPIVSSATVATRCLLRLRLSVCLCKFTGEIEFQMDVIIIFLLWRKKVKLRKPPHERFVLIVFVCPQKVTFALLQCTGLVVIRGAKGVRAGVDPSRANGCLQKDFKVAFHRIGVRLLFVFDAQRFLFIFSIIFFRSNFGWKSRPEHVLVWI